MKQGESFQAAFAEGSFDKEEMWYLVEEQVFRQGLIEAQYQFNNRRYGIEKLANAILRNARDSFRVRAERLEYHFSSPGTLGYEYLAIEDNEIRRMEWARWVARLAQAEGFIQAFFEDAEYSFWQGVYDVDTYERAGRSHAHLTKRKRRMPPPLDDLIIAIEENPGRYIIRDGYIEIVAAEMWLGPEFWARTGADRQKVLECGFLSAEEQDNDVVHLRTGYRTFTEETGVQAQIQNDMRRLLYPNSFDMPLSY